MSNLLIVDDHTGLLSALQHALEDEYEVRCCRSGEEALEIMRTWHPDVLMTDYAMPEMDGLELIKTIRKTENEKLINTNQDRKMKIILLSARLNIALEREALAAGANVCLGKPFDLNELKALVR